MHIPKFSDKLLVTTGTILIAIGISASVAAYGSGRWHRPSPGSGSGGVSGAVIDLLPQNWHYLDGVTQTDTGLLVATANAKIVQQDGSGGQPNPPVNLYGTHLTTSGDFAVTAHLSDQSGTNTIRLYDKPPIIADEFRVEPGGIAVTEQDDTLTVQVWDGSEQSDVTNPQPVFSQQATLADPNADVVISRSGQDLTVQAGSTTITASGRSSIFRSGAVWFGLDSPDGGFMVDKLTAQSLNGATLATVDTTALSGTNSPLGLQALAAATRPDFKVGAAVALGPWVSDSTYSGQLFQNFGAITMENAMKPQFLSPAQGVYTFQSADALIALAHQNGMIVHGHTLAFSEAEPAWMRQLPTDTAAERAATTTILLDYVTHVVQHFKGQLDSLDVINEPLDPDQGPYMQSNVWYRAMGPDYTVRVSQLVHSIDPDVKQYVNENGTEEPGDRQDALLQLVQYINDRGGFIYGVGLQSHVYDMATDTISASDLDRTISRFGNAGFKVRISENDVTDDSGTRAQASQYATVLTTCLRNPNCVSYTTWGVNDDYDWFIDDDGSLQEGHDFLFDGTRLSSAYTSLLANLH